MSNLLAETPDGDVHDYGDHPDHPDNRKDGCRCPGFPCEHQRVPEMSEFYTDPKTGIVYWRDEQGVLRPRVLTDAKGEVVGYEQAAGFFPDRTRRTRV